MPRTVLTLECLEDRVVPAFTITTTALLPLLNVNVAAPQNENATVVTSGGTAPITFAVDAGTALPAGLILNDNTGVVSGTPITPGPDTYRIFAMDSSAAPQTFIATFTSIVLPSGFSYNATTMQLTITPTSAEPDFDFSQQSVQTGSVVATTYTFTLHNASYSASTSASVPGADLTSTPASGSGSVIVNGVGGYATLTTDDTYTDPTTSLKTGTEENIILGSLTNSGVGSISKFTDSVGAATNPYTFLTMTDFPDSYAYVGRFDPTVELMGTQGEGAVGFVSAGSYSYISSATNTDSFHEAAGAPAVYGYSAGNSTDFAYHYSMNPGSSYVVSGVAYSYMSGSQTNPQDANATDKFINEGVGFLQNTGVSNNTGKDFAYIITGPGSNVYEGASGYSYMYVAAPPSPFAEIDAAYNFALYYAQVIVTGGTNTANANAPSDNVFSSGWTFR